MSEQLNEPTQDLSERDRLMIEPASVSADPKVMNGNMAKAAMDKIIGSELTPTERQTVQDIFDRKFTEQEVEEVRHNEIEKTPEQIQVIECVNQLTDQLRVKFGLDPFLIPANNIHIIPREILEKRTPLRPEIDAAHAVFDPGDQAIYLTQGLWERSKLLFAESLFHEMVHFKSHNAIQIHKADERLGAYGYRAGFEIYRRDNSRVYFHPLNEGLTEELAKRFALELSNNDTLLGPEVSEKNGLCEKYDVAPEMANELLFLRTYPDGKIGGQKFTYGLERQALGQLVDKILKKNSDQFSSPDEVLDLFVRGAIPGDVMPIGRIVDESFGKGSFRKIGEATTGEELLQVVQSLA